MTEVEVRYRTWYKGLPPRPIKLQIPGWAGSNKKHCNGERPQPWHCPPFVDGSTYGLELIYPFDNECRVRRVGDEIVFDGDFKSECIAWDTSGEGKPPFLSFAPDHYGMTSALDIMPPEGYCFRLEPHPRFYTDRTGTCPIAAAGNIQRWWGRIFFVAFKSPLEGETHVFRKGEPYAHVLIIPNKPNIVVKQMTEEEAQQRAEQERKLGDYGDLIAKNNWRDHKGLPFNDKYKVLASAFSKDGEAGIQEVIESAQKKAEAKQNRPRTIKKLPRRFIGK